MRTVKSIRAAESFLRKLAGEPSSFTIRTAHTTTMLSQGHRVCGAGYTIKIQTADQIEFDSGAQPTLQLAFDRVCRAITAERARRATHRRLIKRLANGNTLAGLNAREAR